jgi:dihydrofolate reductase
VRRVGGGRTQYYTASSLDGYIADEENGLEWLFQFPDPGEAGFGEFLGGVGAVAMGSTTYEWILEHHLEGGGGSKVWPYAQPSWVFTKRKLPLVEGADIRIVRGDVRPVHERMVEVAGGGNLWIVGGGDLAGQFHDLGLLDDIIVTIASVTLGGGAPLLPRRITTPPLRLVSVRQLGAAFAQLHYEVDRP